MTYYYSNVFINEKYSLLSSSKMNPIVKDNVDKLCDDYYMKCNTIEEAESLFQKKCIDGLLNKSKLNIKDIDLMLGSDLQNQNFASNNVASKYNVSYLGIYSACASFIEGIIIGSEFIKNNDVKVIVNTSSHNLVSEKQFRFPVEYGAIRKNVNSSTCSGAISVLLSRNVSNIRIESATIGNVCVTNHNDTNDMGSAMAPSCANVIHKHLCDTKRNSNYYDLILTGDLGEYGIKVMCEYYRLKYKNNLENVIDSGNIFYTENKIYAGASGPLCIGLTLFDHILKNKKYKRILVVGTGSLHSSLSSNLSLPIPSVSHAISLEVLN